MSKPRIIDVIMYAHEIFHEDTVWEWFYGNNDYFDGGRPWDVLMHGGAEEVMKALEIEKA